MNLNNKRLASLWDNQQFSTKNRKSEKPIDGKFIYSSLFSVGAFATRKDDSIETKFAASTADKLLLKVRSVRDEINKLNSEFLKGVEDIESNPYTPTNSFQIKLNDKSKTPESVMLSKVFVSCDRYFVNMYKARKNGELTERENQELRSAAIKMVQTLLDETNRACISFHRARKQIKGKK